MIETGTKVVTAEVKVNRIKYNAMTEIEVVAEIGFNKGTCLLIIGPCAQTGPFLSSGGLGEVMIFYKVNHTWKTNLSIQESFVKVS